MIEWLRSKTNLRNIELGLGLAVTVVLVALNVRFFRHAGGLWRDEAVSFYLADMPSFAEVVEQNWGRSFPHLWTLLLHAWIYYGPGGLDGSLRFFGLLTALGMIGMYWWSGRQAGVNVPWVMFVLLGLNPNTIIYGSSLRAYGLSIITELWMLGALLLFAREPTMRRALTALVAAVLCVQTLFANSLMLAAAGSAWGLVFLGQRRWKALGLLAAVCALAAVSFLPYFRTYAERSEWLELAQPDRSVSACWYQLLITLSAGGLQMHSLFPGLLLGMWVVCFWQAVRRKSNEQSGSPGVFFWCSFVNLVSLGLYFMYLIVVKADASVCYDLAPIALIAFSVELFLERLIGSNQRGQLIRLSCGIVLALFVARDDWEQVDGRMTSVDLVAAKLKQLAAPADLVVVWPWHYTCVFQRYYGEWTPWIGLPDLDDKRWQNPMPFIEVMRRDDPIKRELDLITQTLQSGHRVWLVGDLKVLQPCQAPGPVSVTPWSKGSVHVYSNHWSTEATFLLQKHCRSIREIQAWPEKMRFQPSEAPSLFVAEGWK